jgi:methylated-DNA-protein-cysteine methyltransferase-like protein
MTSFKKRVLEIVNEIPYGKVASYGQVSLIAGVARGARQVGHILHVHGRTYPWWRVINNAGRISTTFLDNEDNSQRDLLLKEGIIVNEKLELDIEKYRWRPEPTTLKKLQLDDNYIQKVMEKYFS